MLELTIAIFMLLSLILYALMGGADFGGGMWDLLAAGPRAVRQRKAIAKAIGPIWEANHVWLILVVVLLFTGFPARFRRDDDRVEHPPDRDARRHCAARLGFYLPQLRLPVGHDPAPLEHGVWHRELFYSVFSGHDPRRVGHRADSRREWPGRQRIFSPAG